MYRRVLIPLDGSPAAEAVLVYALNLSGRENAEFFLLTVVDPVPSFSSIEPLSGNIVPSQEKISKNYLTKISAQLTAKGYKASSIMRTGPIAVTILEVAKEIGADIIAMSTHARRSVAHFFLGSVTDKLVRTSQIPVLLFRPDEE